MTRASGRGNPLALQIFLASPGDVADERALARQAVEGLNYDPLLRGKVARIATVAWDQPGARVATPASMTPQDAITQGLPKPSDCDIVIVVLWARMGTRLPDHYRKPDDTPYLSGTEWEFFDALDSEVRTGTPITLVYRRTEKVLLDPGDPAFKEKLLQYEETKAFFASFHNRDTSIKRGYSDYERPEDFRRLLEEHLRDIIARLLKKSGAMKKARPTDTALAARPRLWQGSPFPGLRAFVPDDAPIFFGRGHETDALLRLLTIPSTRLVAVVGASGSGKSSLVAAGLIPRLRDNAIAGSKDWLLPHVLAPEAGAGRQWVGLRFTPADLDDNPFLALAVRFSQLLPDAPTPRSVAEELQSGPAAISQLVEAALSGRPEWAEILMFLDQAEQLFSTSAEHHRKNFLSFLAEAAETTRLRILVTIRADFYHRCLDSPRLAEILRNATFPLAAPSIPALFEMINGPVDRSGLQFDDGLPARILQDTGSEPGALALLAFALHGLHEKRTPAGRLTAAAYESFGGVKGAIGQRAEAAFKRLAPGCQSLLNNVFRELVDVNELGVATRRRVELARVVSSDYAQMLISAFADAHLLVTDRQVDGTPVVEVAHEALFREWPRLARSIRDIADDLRTVRQAEFAAAEWERAKRPVIQLWPHERLEFVNRALGHLGMDREDLPEPVKSFIRSEADRLLDELRLQETTPARRVELGDRLARIGDPRPGVRCRTDGVPDIVWCDVPGGTVTLDRARGKFRVAPFAISRYVVTYDQYKAFLEDPHGYRESRWWAGLNHEKRFGAQFREISNCPAENVSWFDAVAFCRWLDMRLRKGSEIPTGCVVRLPTEPEWQQAFTSGCAYRYPWGPKWSDGRANSEEARLERTVAVGVFPRGASKQGVEDLLGNTWEWCLTSKDSPGNAGSVSLGGGRAFRGGAYHDDRLFSLLRIQNARGSRNAVNGFRVCRAPSSSE